MITSFFGQYRFLSNFWPVRVVFDRVGYNSVENAYQAAKTLNLDQRAEFVYCSQVEAKRLGSFVTIRDDWQQVKFDIMFDLLQQKFSNPTLRARLLQTGSEQLIEGNTWDDRIWGCVWVDDRWIGQNRLGKMLMQIRREIYFNTLVTF